MNNISSYCKSYIQFAFLFCLLPFLSLGQRDHGISNEKHRPQIHFSPKTGWINDPNGMVYHKGIYHLFYQHNPDSTVWGPMHWGRATSTDLVHWEEQPIALYPDSLGTIFSGSAIIDKDNTAGFGKDAIIAIYTQHSHELEKAGSILYQNQSIAYSLDHGKTWKKYAKNPVLRNPGIRDFRDPKVIWFEKEKKWIMTLATADHITFYSSKDLKNWQEESKFGKDIGAHGGIWECPDLIQLNYKGERVWILIVNLMPGGPNGGSATQYFTGAFDGKYFHSSQKDPKWIDYGPDEYAGITWFGTGKRKIFLGWMTNWLYANKVPTQNWRGAMTLPRDLRLEKIKGEFWVASTPVTELKRNFSKVYSVKSTSQSELKVNNGRELKGVGVIDLSLKEARSFDIRLFNNKNEEVKIGFDQSKNVYYVDRGKSGDISFYDGFGSRYEVPRLSDNRQLNLTLVVDVASVELFADNGLSVMTATFFPKEKLDHATLKLDEPQSLSFLSYYH